MGSIQKPLAVVGFEIGVHSLHNPDDTSYPSQCVRLSFCHFPPTPFSFRSFVTNFFGGMAPVRFLLVLICAKSSPPGPSVWRVQNPPPGGVFPVPSGGAVLGAPQFSEADFPRRVRGPWPQPNPIVRDLGARCAPFSLAHPTGGRQTQPADSQADPLEADRPPPPAPAGASRNGRRAEAQQHVVLLRGGALLGGLVLLSLFGGGGRRGESDGSKVAGGAQCGADIHLAWFTKGA